jgi:hypothetical protein
VQAATQALALEDATELAHAYVHAVADALGVRALSIKGPAADFYGVRSPRIAADADLLIDPSGFASVVDRLRTAGWRERPKMAGTEGWVEHSVTLVRDGWPCDLDLHDRFPGFLRPNADVFETFWIDRVEAEVAGRAIPIPSRDATILITALHSLRSWAKDPRHSEELEQLLSRFQGRLDDAERGRLARLAGETACLSTIDGALIPLGVPPAPDGNDTDPRVIEWRRLVASGATPTHFWLRGLLGAPWVKWPGELRRILWPAEEALRQSYPTIAKGRAAADRERVRRLGRGLRDLPVALRAYVAARRRSGR